MAEQPTNDSPMDVAMQPFADFWSSYMEQANDNTRKMLEAINGSADPKVWRQRWLEAVTKSLDAYMRTPAFLEAMRHNMDAVTKAKTHFEDARQETARQLGVPTTEDISGLFERMHSVEESVIQKLERIEQKLGALEKQLDGRSAAN